MSHNKFDISKFFHSVKRPSVKQIIFWGVALALTITLFIFLRGFVACWRLTSLPGVAPASCPNASVNTPQVTPGTAVGKTPVASDVAPTPTLAAPASELPPPWDGASRVTVLIIGLDYRDWQTGSGPPRSDTMILLTIDPTTKTAGMLSVPRDLWVNIPGFGYGKINTAYALGEGNTLPGGGPGLAAKTVEAFLGIQIQYYAQIDFNTFATMIDEIGGITVFVYKQMWVDPLGPGNKIYLHRGWKGMDGELALAYARARHTGEGDVDRSRRQQDVIMAIRDRVFSPEVLPRMITKAPALYQELSSGIHTNMSFNDAIRLAMLAQQIPTENIKQGVIDYTMMIDAKSPDGLDILRPFTDKVRVLRDDIFGGGALSPLATGDPTDLMKAEKARVAVFNGSYTQGLAATTGEYLTSLGMNVVSTGNPDQFPNRTIVIDHSGKPYTLRFLMSLMNLASNQIQIRFDPAATADIEVILGADWASNNPMP